VFNKALTQVVFTLGIGGIKIYMVFVYYCRVADKDICDEVVIRYFDSSRANNVKKPVFSTIKNK